MRSTILTILFFVLVGCGGASKQYLFSVDSSHISRVTKRTVQIGVDKVSVPGYLEENQIATQKAEGEISYRNAIWAVPTSKTLTNTLIASLQKKFSNPNVYLYPWDIERENGKRIKVNINKFIYMDSAIKLEATYFVKRIGASSKRSYMFSTQVESSSDTAGIVRAMSKAYARLIDDIGSRF